MSDMLVSSWDHKQLQDYFKLTFREELSEKCKIYFIDGVSFLNLSIIEIQQIFQKTEEYSKNLCNELKHLRALNSWSCEDLKNFFKLMQKTSFSEKCETMFIDGVTISNFNISEIQKIFECNERDAKNVFSRIKSLNFFFLSKSEKEEYSRLQKNLKIFQKSNEHNQKILKSLSKTKKKKKRLTCIKDVKLSKLSSLDLLENSYKDNKYSLIEKKRIKIPKKQNERTKTKYKTFPYDYVCGFANKSSKTNNFEKFKKINPSKVESIKTYQETNKLIISWKKVRSVWVHLCENEKYHVHPRKYMSYVVFLNIGFLLEEFVMRLIQKSNYLCNLTGGRLSIMEASYVLNNNLISIFPTKDIISYESWIISKSTFSTNSIKNLIKKCGVVRDVAQTFIDTIRISMEFCILKIIRQCKKEKIVDLTIDNLQSVFNHLKSM